jgi:hypothetical protein
MKQQVSSPVVKPPARRAPQVRKAPARPRPARSPDADADDSAEARDRAIRETAYAFYEARGCIDGHELDDWFEAEAQVDRAAGADPVESIGPNQPET